MKRILEVFLSKVSHTEIVDMTVPGRKFNYNTEFILKGEFDRMLLTRDDIVIFDLCGNYFFGRENIYDAMGSVFVAETMERIDRFVGRIAKKANVIWLNPFLRCTQRQFTIRPLRQIVWNKLNRLDDEVRNTLAFVPRVTILTHDMFANGDVEDYYDRSLETDGVHLTNIARGDVCEVLIREIRKIFSPHEC